MHHVFHGVDFFFFFFFENKEFYEFYTSSPKVHRNSTHSLPKGRLVVKVPNAKLSTMGALYTCRWSAGKAEGKVIQNVKIKGKEKSKREKT